MEKFINPGNAKAFLGFSLLIFLGNSAEFSILFISDRKDSRNLRLNKTSFIYLTVMIPEFYVWKKKFCIQDRKNISDLRLTMTFIE